MTVGSGPVGAASREPPKAEFPPLNIQASVITYTTG